MGHLISESFCLLKYTSLKKHCSICNLLKAAIHNIDVSVIKTATEEKKKQNKQTMSVLYVQYISIKIKM